MNPLVELHKHGQSFWYDNMSRNLITSGELARLVKEDGLRGMILLEKVSESSEKRAWVKV